MPGSSFGTPFFRAFEYFVCYPGGIACFPRTCAESDDFHLFPPCTPDDWKISLFYHPPGAISLEKTGEKEYYVVD
jgi:hypothetical protein